MTPSDWLPIILAAALSLTLTPLVRALARRWGMVAKPRSDRWHQQPTALLGGLAIGIAVLVAAGTLPAAAPQTWIVLAASAFLGLVGLVDDVAHLKPYQKLIGQVIAAAAVASCGLLLSWTPSPLLNLAITLLWLVGITNAVNLLDNMDGLAAGVGSIAAGFLALHFLGNDQAAEAVLMLVLAAALLGFLAYNWNPASIFMGDCGSMFLGCFLASGALLSSSGGRSRGLLPVLAVPVLVLFIPIFDTILVTVLRQLAGRPVSQGGRDHTSHRLVALGLSERSAVLLLYGLAALSGITALLVQDLPLDLSLAIIAAFSVVLVLIGVYLAGVKVYREEELAAAREQPLVAFLLDLSYKRRIFEVCLDVVLVILAYYFAQVMLFGPLDQDRGPLFLQTVSLLVIVKIATFLILGVYRGLWRYASLHDVFLYARAVAVSSVASVLLFLAIFRFDGFSRAAFILDGILLFLMLTGSRLAFRFLRGLLPQPAPAGRRILIYGAGDGGELVLQELLNNPKLLCQPVAFVDDDPHKQGKVMHGLPVYAGNGHLPELCSTQQAAEVVLSSMKFSDERVRQIRAQCEKAGVTLKRMRLVMETLHDHDSDSDLLAPPKASAPPLGGLAGPADIAPPQ